MWLQLENDGSQEITKRSLFIVVFTCLNSSMNTFQDEKSFIPVDSFEKDQPNCDEGVQNEPFGESESVKVETNVAPSFREEDWREVGRTETLKNPLRPWFRTTTVVPYK